VTHVANKVFEWVHRDQSLRHLKSKAKNERNVQLQEREGLLLVGCCGRLFTVGSDCQVTEALDGYDAIGTGDDAALGALYATAGEDPVERVCKALRAEERLTGQVRPPWHVQRRERTNVCEERDGARPHLRAV
jgi:hypothetical protein